MRICFRGLLRSAPSLADEQAADSSPLRAFDRMAQLEAEVAQLRRELEDLKQQFAGFQKQFE